MLQITVLISHARARRGCGGLGGQGVYGCRVQNLKATPTTALTFTMQQPGMTTTNWMEVLLVDDADDVCFSLTSIFCLFGYDASSTLLFDVSCALVYDILLEINSLFSLAMPVTVALTWLPR